jgi:hypothetical protein
LPRNATDETAALKLDDHSMNRWGRDSEVGFHVRFGWGTSVDERVVMDESEVLALLVGEQWL